MAQGSTARRPVGQQLAYLRKAVAFNTTGIATGVSMGKIPAGTKIHSCVAGVTEGFNSAGTNRLVVGTNSTSYNNIANTTDFVAASITNVVAKVAYRGATLAFTQDTEVFIKYTEATGTAATSGQATIILAYTVDNQGS